MTSAAPPPWPDETTDPQPRRYWTPGKIALGALTMAMIGFWGWIFLFAPRDNPDELDSTTYAVEAEAVCAATQAQINALPSPAETRERAERTEQVRIGTDLTATMVDELRALAADESSDDRELLDLWLEDWDAYVADREAHIVKLETAPPDASGRDLAFLLTERASGGVYTRRIDAFATANIMESCMIPGDL